ncbi:ADP-ribose diphosphatase [Vibrio sp. SM6]|uniref:ADP-ribose pyrophosphatase n=1 Tax=Vibrio agarilyticus TaxID=2726741 RepID=A0A7X8YGE4_9VIBR|nr:ADP-ribose diphosphatase [Vibrio agarilyticus]NLS12326.1 ADP-ribose diphosphatase [Vibrio agarilyticus]
MPNLDKQDQQFTPSDVKIISKDTLFQGYFRMSKYRFQHRKFAGGWSAIVERELFERGEAVAILPYDPVRDEIVFIEQIRVGALEHPHPWQYEIVAGVIDRDENGEAVARREAEEEAGVSIGRMQSLLSYYPSSGGCSERIELFVGEVDASQAKGIHGLDYENEDIRVFVLSREEAMDWLAQGKFENGATIIALQWLALNHLTLKSQWLDS